MKILIAEDDFANRRVLKALFSQYGSCDMVTDGSGAIDLFTSALELGEPYDLICLDALMPNVDGAEALQAIRGFELKAGIEEQEGARIVFISSLDDRREIMPVFQEGIETLITKPITRKDVERVLSELSLD